MNPDRVIAVRNAKTIYREGNKCIKVFNKEYSKADVLNEALNHARVEETGLNIPKIIEVTIIDGKWAIVYEYIKGKTLAQLIKDNPDKKEEYMELFVDLQLLIHSKTNLLLNKLKDKTNLRLGQADIDATTRYALHTRLEEMPKSNKLCHGDFNPSNIIISEDGTPYVIDWSHATQGNASADAARSYLLFRLSDDADGAKQYLELFCKKSGTAKQCVQKWMPIVAASQSVKSNEKERELLLSWVSAMDYE